MSPPHTSVELLWSISTTIKSLSASLTRRISLTQSPKTRARPEYDFEGCECYTTHICVTAHARRSPFSATVGIIVVELTTPALHQFTGEVWRFCFVLQSLSTWDCFSESLLSCAQGDVLGTDRLLVDAALPCRTFSLAHSNFKFADSWFPSVDVKFCVVS